MNTGEYLYPLPSVMAFVSENLNVYRMEKDGTPNIDLQSTVGMLTSNWVNVINEEDDFLLSELIYWKQRGV
jgi:hypothetical protein